MRPSRPLALFCLVVCSGGSAPPQPIDHANDRLARALGAVGERRSRVLADLERIERLWLRTAFLTAPALLGMAGVDAHRTIETRLTFDLPDPPYRIGYLKLHGLVGALWVLSRNGDRRALSGATFEEFAFDAVAFARSIRSAPEARAKGSASPPEAASLFLTALAANGLGAVRERSPAANLARPRRSETGFRLAARLVKVAGPPAEPGEAQLGFARTTESAAALCARLETRNFTINWRFVPVRGQWMADALEGMRVP